YSKVEPRGPPGRHSKRITRLQFEHQDKQAASPIRGQRRQGTAPIQPVLQPAPANRWGVWITGFGDFVNVDSDFDAKGYNLTTGGFTLGLDFRLLDNLSVGVMGSYAHTWTNLQPAGNIDVDSGRGGLYATWWDHGFYVNTVIYGGHNNFESNRAGLGGVARPDLLPARNSAHSSAQGSDIG